MRVISLMVLMCLMVTGQAKRPVTFADYDTWKAITGQTLSADGKWLAYALMPQVGDGEVIARELATGREIRIPAGMQPPRPEAEGEGEIGPTPPRGPRVVFAGDGRFVVTQTFTPKGTKTPKGGLAILALATGVVTRIENVKSFAVAETGAAVVAYLEDSPGKRLGLRPLDGAASRTYEGIAEYALSRDGATLAAGGAEEVFAITVADGARTVLKSGKGRYAKLMFDADGTQLAFLADGAAYGWRRGHRGGMGEGAGE